MAARRGRSGSFTAPSEAGMSDDGIANATIRIWIGIFGFRVPHPALPRMVAFERDGRNRSVEREPATSQYLVAAYESNTKSANMDRDGPSL